MKTLELYFWGAAITLGSIGASFVVIYLIVGYLSAALPLILQPAAWPEF